MSNSSDFNLYTEFFQHKKYIATPVAAHSHECCEFSFIKGNGYVIIDDVSYDFTDNTIIITPPNAIHSFYGTIEEDIYFGFYYKGIENINTAVYTSENSFDFIYKVLSSIENWYNRSGKNSIQIINEYAKIILNTYFRNKSPSSKDLFVTFEKAIQYIDTHYNTDIKPEQIAKISGYSYHHFRHEFKKRFNVTIKEYINEMRIMNAKSLLRLTSHSIKYIAIECGFSTSAYFVTAFKQSTGISPLEYRKRKNTNIEKYAYIPWGVNEDFSSYEKSSFWKAVNSQYLFNFDVNNTNWEKYKFIETTESVENNITKNYAFENGLCTTQSLKQFPDYDVIKWENSFQMTNNNSIDISNVVDCECTLPFLKKLVPDLMNNTFKNEATIKTVRFANNSYEYAYENSTTIQINDKISFSSCSEDNNRVLPFLSFSRNGEGYFVAIGWTEKWNCDVSMTNEGFKIKIFINDSSFSLSKGECLRTASIYIMMFKNDKMGANNKWRRFLSSKIHNDFFKHQNERMTIKYPISTDISVDKLKSKILSLNKKIENKYIYTNCDYQELYSITQVKKIAKISETAHKNGLKIALRITVDKNSSPYKPTKTNLFSKNWQLLFQKINVDTVIVNFDELISYHSNKNYCFVKIINSLYNTIDMLKNEFPNICFENISGENNSISLDIEMMKRVYSIWAFPLVNCNNILTKYFPIIGCNLTAKNDINSLTYHISPILSVYDIDEHSLENKTFENFIDLYKKICAYFDFDYYNITFLPKNIEWVGSQFHDIEKDKGVIIVTRKTNSNDSEAKFYLRNLNINNSYTFISANGNSFEISAKASFETGIPMQINDPKSTEVWFYSSK